MRATTKLRHLLTSGDTLVAPGVYDGLSARLVARAGFPPVHLAPISFEALYQQQLAQMALPSMAAGGSLILVGSASTRNSEDDAASVRTTTSIAGLSGLVPATVLP